jgi:hypothetical protein
VCVCVRASRTWLRAIRRLSRGTRLNTCGVCVCVCVCVCVQHPSTEDQDKDLRRERPGGGGLSIGPQDQKRGAYIMTGAPIKVCM